ncbi:MAG: hypothetical protein ACTSR8_07045 [Promethearchaeota archaeon]
MILLPDSESRGGGKEESQNLCKIFTDFALLLSKFLENLDTLIDRIRNKKQID